MATSPLNFAISRRVPFVEPVFGFAPDDDTEFMERLRKIEWVLTRSGSDWLASTGGGTGGGGSASVYNLDILGVAQVVDAPIMATGVGQQLIYELNTNADPASVVWGIGFDPAADTRINYMTGKVTVFHWYAQNRGLGLLWYLVSAPYMWPVL